MKFFGIALKLGPLTQLLERKKLKSIDGAKFGDGLLSIIRFFNERW